METSQQYITIPRNEYEEMKKKAIDYDNNIKKVSIYLVSSVFNEDKMFEYKVACTAIADSKIEDFANLREIESFLAKQNSQIIQEVQNNYQQAFRKFKKESDTIKSKWWYKLFNQF